MDELFRFVALRPPARNPDAIDLDNQSPLAANLADVRNESNAREQTQELVRSFTQSDEFVRDSSSLSLPLGRLADAIDEENPLDMPALATLIEASLGSPAASVAKSPEFSADLQRLQDSVLAFKIAPPENADPNAALRLLRAADLVQRVALELDDVDVSTRRLVRMPDSVFPLPPEPIRAEEISHEMSSASIEPTQAELVERAKAIGEALKTLRTVRVSEPVAPTSGSVKMATVSSIDRRRTGSKTKQLKTKISLPPSPRTSALVLNDLAISALSPVVLRTLSGVGVDPAKTTLPVILHTLGKELGNVERRIDVDTALYRPDYGPYKPLTEPQQHDDASDPKPVNLLAPPITHGQVKPAGIADLLVVLQHVIGYSPGEVAYVENVAQGEKFVRTTRRSDLTEDVAVTVRETGREQERDVQATDRFDLRRESNEVLRSDTRAREPGSPGSESHGVLVETGASMDQAQRAAETFGRDVTTRAVGRVTERLRTETTHRTVQEFAEEVRHEFDNTTGTAREILVYQWLDRVVQAQVFSYGKRLFYDLVLPEPAALLLRALSRRLSPNGPLIKPAPFTLEPSQINEVNYTYYVAGYGATGVEPPPEPEIIVAESFGKSSLNKYAVPPAECEIHEVQKSTLLIPPGYRAVKAKIEYHFADFETAYAGGFILIIGDYYLDLAPQPPKGPPIKEFDLEGEVGKVPVALCSSNGEYIYALTVELVCQPTEHWMDVWRQRTYDAILQASRQRMTEYEERATNIRASLRMEAINFTPERKRSTEREELQRSCLAALTNQQFDGLSAIEHSVEGYPQPYLPNVEPLGRYVRFLQQAFEWEQMTWRYYPYFWGRKPYWFEKVLLDDNDTQFRDFLRAGSARVLLPVRPGFEGAVAHFMETGSVPTVEELGQIAGKLYLPFLAEEIGFDVATESATPYGEPWKLRVPTALVKLRSDQSTPTWTASIDVSGRFVWAAGAGDPL